MKSFSPLLMLIGGWILFAGLDCVGGRMTAAHSRSWRKPLRTAFAIVGGVRTAALFFLAVATFVVMAGHQGSCNNNTGNTTF